MKKLLSLLLAACLLLAALAGCSDKEAPQPDGEEDAVDVDLTLLSSTVAMAEVSNIMENSEEYIGKKIKIRGPYIASYYDKTGKYYHYVLIDACCTGFEFILNGEHTYPDDYPADMALIEVTGIFGRYEELGQAYHYLAVDEMKVF